MFWRYCNRGENLKINLVAIVVVIVMSNFLKETIAKLFEHNLLPQFLRLNIASVDDSIFADMESKR